MAIGANSYGSVAEVAAGQPLPAGGPYGTAGWHLVIEVEGYDGDRSE